MDVARFNEVVDGLNWFSGRGLQTLSTGTAAKPTEVTRRLRGLAESRIWRAVRLQRPPADTPAPAAAFRELLRCRDAYAVASTGGQNIAPYRSTPFRPLGHPREVTLFRSFAATLSCKVRFLRVFH